MCLGGHPKVSRQGFHVRAKQVTVVTVVFITGSVLNISGASRVAFDVGRAMCVNVAKPTAFCVGLLGGTFTFQTMLATFKSVHARCAITKLARSNGAKVKQITANRLVGDVAPTRFAHADGFVTGIRHWRLQPALLTDVAIMLKLVTA